MNDAMTQISPISRIVRLDNVPKAGLHVEIDADDAQRARLASDHGLVEVSSFHAEIGFSLWRQRDFRLEGRIYAAIVQQCSVTLEPIAAVIDVPVENFLVEEKQQFGPHTPTGEELVLSVDAADEPETYRGNRFDIGAFVEELFALSIDPYPRIAGVSLAKEIHVEEDESPREDSPFSRLKDLDVG